MGERLASPSFERRRVQMMDVTRFVMSHHPKEIISNGWTGFKDTNTAFLQLTKNVVENAVATVMAAETRFELAKEAKKFTSSQELPHDEKNKALAKQLIKDITRQSSASPNVYETKPQLNLRRDIAQNLAKLEHLCKLDALMSQDLSPTTRQELLDGIFRGNTTIEEKLKFVAILSAYGVTGVDKFLSGILPQGKPIDMTIFSRRSRDPQSHADLFEELEIDLREAS